MLFLQSKPKWRFSHDVWFTIALIGRNQLHFIMGKLIGDFLDLKNVTF